MAIPAPLLEAIHEGVVVCPRCLGTLATVAANLTGGDQGAGDAVRCTRCEERFPVRDDVLDFLARDQHGDAR